jgi:predicted O-methyltransferase YrrM
MKKLITRVLRALQWRTYVFSENLLEILESRVSSEDVSLIRRRIPALIDAGALTKCYDELKCLHQDYCMRYSDRVHVVSLEQAAFLLNACHTLNPNRIVDLGSGFSSFVVRSYARENTNCRVLSVDDDPRWLGRTEQFLKEQKVSTDDLLLSKDFFREAHSGSFDLVFYDLGTMQTRAENFEQTLNVLNDRPGSLMIIDDVHKSDYRLIVSRLLRDKRIQFFNLKKITGDEYGRYAYAILH